MKKAIALLALLLCSCSPLLIPDVDWFNLYDDTGTLHSYLKKPEPPEELMCYVHGVEELVEIKKERIQLSSK